MDQQNAFLALQDDPSKLLELICSHVASGGSLVALSESWQVPYRKLLHWVREAKHREEAYQQACVDREEWCKDKVLQELRILASFDIRKMFDEQGNIIAVHQWPEEVAKCIEGFDVVENFEQIDGKKELSGYVKKFKAASRRQAIETLMKNLGLLTPSVELNAGKSLEALLANTWSEEKPDE